MGEPVRKQLHPVLMRPPPEIRRHAAMRMHEVGQGGIALCRQINWTSLAIIFYRVNTRRQHAETLPIIIKEFIAGELPPLPYHV